MSNLTEIREQLAAIEHERWADWQKWVHQQLHRNNYGEWVLPEEVKYRWERQIETEYEHLSEKEKASDREQVDRYLPIILAWVEKDVIGADYYFNDDAFPTGAEKIRLEERNKLLAMQRKRARL